MGRYAWAAGLLFVAAIVSLVGLFAVQNSSRSTQLSLDVGVAAWQLEQPVSVPLLMAACLGGGWLVAAIPLGLRSYTRGRRVKQLERDLSLNDATRAERPW